MRGSIHGAVNVSFPRGRLNDASASKLREMYGSVLAMQEASHEECDEPTDSAGMQPQIEAS